MQKRFKEPVISLCSQNFRFGKVILKKGKKFLKWSKNIDFSEGLKFLCQKKLSVVTFAFPQPNFWIDSKI